VLSSETGDVQRRARKGGSANENDFSPGLQQSLDQRLKYVHVGTEEITTREGGDRDEDKKGGGFPQHKEGLVTSK